MKNKDYILENLIQETLKKKLYELNWSHATDAYDVSERRTDLFFYANNFFENAELMIKALAGDSTVNDWDYEPKKDLLMQHDTTGKKLSEELKVLVDKIQTYVDRKEKQTENLKRLKDNKYKQQFGRTQKELEKDIDKKYDSYNYNDDEEEWQNNNLTSDEQEYVKKYY